MWAVKDKTGMRYGRLVVISRAANSNDGKAQWLCKCDCGNYKVIRSCNLRESGTTTSCGCYKKEKMKHQPSKITHGMSKTRIYTEWGSMKWRCSNKTNTSYKRYGGRGISVCDEWKNNFLAFYEWAMSHGYSDELTLDRIDVNGNYEPDNCRWVTQKEQARNKRNNRFINYKGVEHTGSEWSELLGSKDRHLVYDRIDRGWSIEDAVTKPLKMKTVKEM